LDTVSVIACQVDYSANLVLTAPRANSTSRSPSPSCSAPVFAHHSLAPARNFPVADTCGDHHDVDAGEGPDGLAYRRPTSGFWRMLRRYFRVCRSRPLKAAPERWRRLALAQVGLAVGRSTSQHESAARATCIRSSSDPDPLGGLRSLRTVRGDFRLHFVSPLRAAGLRSSEPTEPTARRSLRLAEMPGAFSVAQRAGAQPLLPPWLRPARFAFGVSVRAAPNGGDSRTDRMDRVRTSHPNRRRTDTGSNTSG
jgi:hypothetical protein